MEHPYPCWARAKPDGEVRRTVGVSHPSATSHRRGGVYLVVLAAAMIVSLIGLTALTVVRAQVRSFDLADDGMQAELLADAAIQIARRRLDTDPNWRSNYTNDTWTGDIPTTGGVMRFKLVDEADGNLADDPTEPVRVYAMGVSGKATRLVSAELASVSNSANLLANGGFESGVSPWSAYPANNDADLVIATDAPFAGNAYLRVTNRDAVSAGIDQVFDSYLLTSGGNTYDVEVWVRMTSGTENVRIRLKTTTLLLLTEYTNLTSWTSVGTTWTRVAGRANRPGSLTGNATIFLETDSTRQDFHVDEFRLLDAGTIVRQVYPVEGTWRQEVLP